MKVNGTAVITIGSIKLIYSLFPEARYICLYRDCLDQVLSARETLKKFPTGHEYGLMPYLQRSPASILDGLVDYWIAKTSSILEFEKNNPEKCIRIKYESMVLDTHATLSRLFCFLVSHWGKGMEDAIFKNPPKGPGDPKITRTSKINISSVGNGAVIETQEISNDRVKKMNWLLELLDYTPVEN